MTNPHNEYEKRFKNYDNLIKEQSEAINRISNLRLLTFLVGFGVTLYTSILKVYLISGIIFSVSCGIFIYLVIRHSRVIDERIYSYAFKNINDKSLKRLSGEWKKFDDDGKEFEDEGHSYSGDLDIFGKGSLFQWINSSNTYLGRQELKNRLTNPLKSKEHIKQTQEGVKELGTQLDWRQKFFAEGLIIADNSSNPENLLKWAEERHEFYSKPWLVKTMRILPFITILLILLSFLTPYVHYYWRVLAICVQIIILVPGNDKRTYALNTIYKHKDSIKIYHKMLNMVQTKEFDSEYLKNLKSKLFQGDIKSATKSINELFRVSDMISDRKNLFYIVIDILFLWDYQCMIQLEKWRIHSGKYLVAWLNTIANFEALCSISNICYDNEEWAFPEVTEKGKIVKSEALAHPLLGENRVANDFKIDSQQSILLITGSNMSGKSTLLRTVGINLILCYVGAPVCAKSFYCSLMDIYTCMRISDNLEKNISSFYAEILRIKMIVGAAKEKGKGKVFFLLDEIFKGTNSSDRHLGAKILIKQLGEQGTAGLVSTHDLELGEMEREYNKLKNYHFREYYNNGELKFDYKLRIGVSNTKNALYLIKMAGIDME